VRFSFGMERSPRYAITGATGFLGRRLCRVIKQRYQDSQILALGRRAMEICPGVHSHAIDLKVEYSKVEQIMSEFKPDFLLMLAAKTMYP